MKSKILLLTISTLSVLTFQSVWAQSCNTASANEVESPVTILKNVNGANSDTESYPFAIQNCAHATNVSQQTRGSSNELMDETALGLYSMYREAGESPAQATKDAKDFMAKFN